METENQKKQNYNTLVISSVNDALMKDIMRYALDYTACNVAAACRRLIHIGLETERNKNETKQS